MNLPPGDADVTNAFRRREAPRRAVQASAGEARPLLLDEPTNHLDAESVAWLERHLEEYPGTVVAVTHDRYFLDNVAKWILELDYGKGHPFEGNYSSWLEQKSKRLAVEEKQGLRPAEDAGPRAGVGAHVAQGPAGQEQGPHPGLREDGGRAVRGPAGRTGNPDSARPAAGRHGHRGRTTSAKSYGDRVIFENVNFRLPPGGIVGIIGPNGAGKTTLLRMLMGQEQPDEGELQDRRRPSSSATSINRATTSRPTTPCTRKSPAATTRSRWAAAR